MPIRCTNRLERALTDRRRGAGVVTKKDQPCLTCIFYPSVSESKPKATRFVPHVLANQRADGMWEAWIEFHPEDGGPVRATDRESTQPNRTAVEYWVSGLEPVYFEGAFVRAVSLKLPLGG